MWPWRTPWENGVADDKAIYAHVPAFIGYLPRRGPGSEQRRTYLCSNPEHLSYVLDSSSRERLRADPRNYIAQLIIGLSLCPSHDPHTRMAGRHIDLRPDFLFDGEKVVIVPGGLTRVALQAGSLVVNSSQGGGKLAVSMDRKHSAGGLPHRSALASNLYTFQRRSHFIGSNLEMN